MDLLSVLLQQFSQAELYFKGLRNLEEPWKSIDDIRKAFSGHHTPISGETVTLLAYWVRD